MCVYRGAVPRATRPTRAALALALSACEVPQAHADPPADPAPALDRRAACLARNHSAPERYRGLVRAFCADVHNLGGVGAGLALAEGGALVFTAVAGERCAGGRPVDADTAFRVGSLTKLLTAALALTYVDEGRLDLDAPLLDLLPELADGRAARTSLRQLLSHSAGLPDPSPRELGPDWPDDLLLRERLAEPGATWSYSNAGYALAGLALERLDGRPYAQLLDVRVVRPLGLANATADLDLALRSGAACGHLGRGDRALPLDVRSDLSLGAGGATWTIPAGGLVAPARALVDAALGLADPLRSPLSAPAIAALLGPQVPTEERPGESYALGVRVQVLDDGSALHLHSGDTGDFAADLYFAPDRGFALALVSNTGDPLRATAAAALRDLLGAMPPLPGPPDPPATLAGVYTVEAWTDPISITVAGDALALTSPQLGLAGAPLEHAGDRRYRVRGRPALGHLTFLHAGARPSHLRGRGFFARRAGGPPI